MPSEYYLKNKERILARGKKYHAEHPDVRARWRKKNRIKISEDKKEKYNDDPLFHDLCNEAALYSYYRRRLNSIDSDDPKYHFVQTKFNEHKIKYDDIRKRYRERKSMPHMRKEP